MEEPKTDALKKKMQDILDRQRWMGFVDGKIEGALNVLYLMDLDKEKRIELLSEAVGLSSDTAAEFLKPKEIEYQILKREDLTGADKTALLSLLTNEAMMDKTVIEYPKQTLAIVSSFAGKKFVEECLPQIDIWTENGEKISMSRIRDWLIKKYGLY